MGKATITAVKTGGLYTAQINYNRDRVTAAIAALTAKIAALAAQIAYIETTEIPPLEAQVAAKRQELTNYERLIIVGKDDINNPIYGLNPKWKKCYGELSALSNQLAQKTDRRNSMKVQQTGAEKQKQYLEEKTPKDYVQDLWCADYNEDLKVDDVVATIEVPGEATGINIQASDNTPWAGDSDGQLFSSIAVTPAAAFRNLALLPGWQRWMPTYRYATITEIDHDANTCTVELAAAASTQLDDKKKNIEVNLFRASEGATVFEDVPLTYMD